MTISGAPGDVLRVEPLPVPVPGEAQAWRVLYVSTGLSGEPITVSGVVAAPRGEPPRKGARSSPGPTVRQA
ncbi:hypothetical protein [Chelativorans sp. AA-79]|uniref:hypothetical protein n=1 Tax=Chelativorans sp. AA-79 TaxID=3028735 RepID=UPI0023F6C7AF|nr:hypothetical protein [Chelativorans sp. AA-79]WEX07409.1 hypothetical protein PVE73_14905 [Chelativorans sp. AA-79]